MLRYSMSVRCFWPKIAAAVARWLFVIADALDRRIELNRSMLRHQ